MNVWINSLVIILYVLTIVVFLYQRHKDTSNLSFFYLVFVVALPFLGVLLLYMMRKPSNGRHRRHSNVAQEMRVDEDIAGFSQVLLQAHRFMTDDCTPLEGGLYLNQSAETREQLMALAGNKPDQFMEQLYLARANQDTEIVHYATTFIAEISRQYEKKAEALEKQLQLETENLPFLADYCDFMEDYLSKGFLSQQMEKLIRQDYEEILLRKAQLDGSGQDYERLLRNELALNAFDNIPHHLRLLSKLRPLEDVYLFYLEFYYKSGQYDAFHKAVSDFSSADLSLSPAIKEYFDFWSFEETH